MNNTDSHPELEKHERDEIVEILRRRANDVATFKYDIERAAGDKIGVFPGSVEMALSREVDRLRRLAHRVEVAGRTDQQVDQSKGPIENDD